MVGGWWLEFWFGSVVRVCNAIFEIVFWYTLQKGMLPFSLRPGVSEHLKLKQRNHVLFLLLQGPYHPPFDWGSVYSDQLYTNAGEVVPLFEDFLER